MKKNLKRFIGTLIIVICMTCTAFAKVDLNIDVKGSDVTIKGKSDHKSKNVMIQTWSGDRTYYIDAVKTDSEGNFEFKFRTKENLDYNGKLNIGGEIKKITFSTKKSDSGKTSGSSSGGSSGGSSSVVNEKKDKGNGQEGAKELKDKLEKISIKDNELNIKKEGEKALLSIKEGALNSAIKEVEELIKEIEEKHEDINLKKDINVIPIDISKTKEEKIVFRVEEDSIKTLKDKGLGVKINFGDIEVKVPNTIIARESDGKQLEIRKNVASKNIENKIVKALNDKVLLPSYNVSLYEVGDSEKKVSMKGTEVSVKVDSKYFKNIRKNGTKIKLYDSESGKWILLKSKFDEKTNRVIGNVR